MVAMIIIISTKSINYVVIFDGAPHVQLGDDILKIIYPKLAVMCGV